MDSFTLIMALEGGICLGLLAILAVLGVKTLLERRSARR